MGYPTGLSAAAGVSAKANRKDLGKTDCTSGKAKEGKSRTITVVKEPAEMNSAGSFCKLKTTGCAGGSKKL